MILKRVGVWMLILMCFTVNFKSLGQIKVADENYFEHYTRFDTLGFDFQTLSNKLKNGGTQSVEFYLKNYGRFKVEISPSNLELANTQYFVIDGHNKRLIAKNPTMHHWKGQVFGTDKIVRLNVYENHLSGYIEQDTGFIFIETISIWGQNRLFVYHSSESTRDEMMNFCGVTEKGNEESNRLNKKAVTYQPLSCHILKLANVAAYGLFKKNNYDTAATFSEIADIINLADGVYAKYLGLRLKIAFQAISLDSLTVYNNSRSTLDRIYDFENRKSQFVGTILPDIYHLFMENYSPTDNAIGRGYLGGTCNNNNSSVSMDYGDLSYRTKVFCHELGHNLNANHEDGRNCGSKANATIMCSGINPDNLVFGSAEINVMQQFISSKLSASHPVSCLSYPMPDEKFELDLCDKDSVLISFKRAPDFGLFLFHDEVLINYTATDNLVQWVKEPGAYNLKYVTDTVSGLACYLEKEAYAAERNFEVSNPYETGRGSLKYAILNANGCKGSDTIKFNLPDSIKTINVTEVLPPVIDHCVIDGTTAYGYKTPSSSKKYQPKVILINKLPSSVYIKYGLLLSRNRHTIRGIEFRNFEYAITNDFNCFKNSIWGYLLNEKNRQDTSDVVIFANKFMNNQTGIHLSYYDSLANNDHTEIGDGSLKHVNFFTAPGGTGIRVAYAQSLKIDGNYFGLEPAIDTAESVSNPIWIYRCNAKVKIVNNHFGKSQWRGVYSYSSSGEILNNTFGLNPFNKNIIGFKGSAIYCDGYFENEILAIGGIGAEEGNLFYGQKKAVWNEGVLMSNASKNLTFTGNRVINPDTTSIILIFPKANAPVKSISLDSSVHHCQSGNSVELYGKIEPRFSNDTFTLHFYATPPNVKTGMEPMHRYLGSKTLIAFDTFSLAFSQTIPDCQINEGIVFTATSHQTHHTSQLSNVVYPGNVRPISIANLVDTTLCPTKTLSLTFNSRLSDISVNNVAVGKNFQIYKPGLYEIKAMDSEGCSYGQSYLISYFPNYLYDAKLVGSDYYSWAEAYTYTAVDYYDPKRWGHPVWSVVNGYVEDKNKYTGLAVFLKDIARITYQITDSNRCTYSISKTVYHNTVGIKDIGSEKGVNIYPNPSDGLVTISMDNPERMVLYNAIGEVIQTYQTIDRNPVLNLSEYAAGIYFLWIENYGYYKLLKR